MASGSFCVGMHRANSLNDGRDDVLVTRTAADVACEPVAHRLGRGLGIEFGEIDRTHDHSWRTESALQSVLLVESLLHRMQAAGRRQAFDAGHRRAVQ